jgi:O-antigen/teichoic acid export membrane protein
VLPSLFKSLAGSAGIRLLGMGFGFLVGIQLARGLGVEGYGVYGLVMSWVSLAVLGAEFGIPHLATREIASAMSSNSWGRIQQTVRWCFVAVARLSALMLIAGAIALALFPLEQDALKQALWVGLLLVPLTAFGNLGGGMLRGAHRIVAGQLPEFVLRPALFSLFLGLMVLAADGITVSSAMLASVLAAGLSAVVAIGLMRQVTREQDIPTESVFSTNHLWAAAWPMAITEAVRVLNGNVAMLVLGMLGTAEHLGWFRVALSVSVLIAMPVSLVHIVTAPMFARMHASGDKTALQRLLGWTAVIMTAGVTVAVVPFLIWGETLLRWMFGAGFEGGHAPLLIVSLGALISALLGAAPILLNMVGQERRVARGYGVAMACLTVLCLILIPRFGHMGAAWASLISVVIGSGLMWRDAHRIAGLDTSIRGCFVRPLSR